MNKFINVTVDGKVLSVNVNHIVAIEESNDNCTVYLSYPVKSQAFRNVKESREEILNQINE
jgi:uncharacterized protein YlzI (FlbEa/FlbD family)